MNGHLEIALKRTECKTRAKNSVHAPFSEREGGVWGCAEKDNTRRGGNRNSLEIDSSQSINKQAMCRCSL